MTDRVEKAGLHWDAQLAAFVEQDVLPGSGISDEAFWGGMSALVQAYGPKTAELLAKRQDLQEKIDAWHVERRGQPHDAAAYEAFLTEIGYLEAEPEDVQIDPQNIDPEIAAVCAPQLVVPSTNARFVLNAANARWGSLYDALYGTDALGSPAPEGDYDLQRGAEVVAWAKAHLDAVVPLTKGSWSDVVTMAPSGGKLMMIAGKGTTELADPSQFAGYNRDDKGNLTDVFFRANNLHIAVFIDRDHPVGKTDTAGIADVMLEAAASTIVDFEDSVACVDAEDKILAYRNWLGLMKGDLTEEVTKGGETFTRDLNPDVGFEGANGQPVLLKGRSLLLVRNVGLLMTTPAVLDADGNEVPEHLLDALVSIAIGKHDLLKTEGPKNSPAGSIYVVKPKLHGADEVHLTNQVFTAVEKVTGLPAGTVKIGIMDEERRTSANLGACITAAGDRVAFINTGFLDRTGDEIHTSMEAGPMRPKGDMKSSTWLLAYEDRNVDIGMKCGLKGRAQIGKGMWAMPDRMGDMLEQKQGHPKAGATCAWVPSPTAAVLHATHYHKVDVFQRLYDISQEAKGAVRQSRAALLEIPLLEQPLPPEQVQAEVENNCQGILGYVVRWIDQGVGCSKVPDIHDVGLMEDRATLRISAQGLANWLHHEVVTEDQVMAALKKMAEVVDRQNAADPAYTPMAPGFDGVAFQAACDLVFKGRVQPSGYTEPVLHARRAQAKAVV
ncbi:malate synthase G [Actibacterium sp. 188UL27-1]|uniref:malate synthase G n=1 Tax=Actibacterium sp. 188UL27-1 TaxID=2786961 RepID=UPI00195AC156|nr:malate synthase G [Actibacterium sp. 188UL27-1]MBM7066980.1 malate synthase G [Actibacterium sp. 188UL27-1]